jgi:hypothetical protein
MKSYGCFIRSVALALMCAGALLTSCSEKSLGAYDESELDFYAAPPSGYNNLSALSTANCYILNQSGDYCIAFSEDHIYYDTPTGNRAYGYSVRCIQE